MARSPAASAIILAIPSKGRLQEQVTHYLGDAGLKLKQVSGARDYRANLVGHPDIDVKMMSAAEIAAGLGTGEVHLGITGEDLVRDSIPDAAASIVLLQALGFGFADVVVAVPRAWLDVSTMADLDDVCTAFHARHHRRLRIATKYLSLTRSFFAAHGIADYRIVESLGATEGAPAAGLAEAIVDITTTGATLAANELKILDDGVILKSQAQLAASLRAGWGAAQLDAADRLTARIAARELARSSYVLRAELHATRGKLVKALEEGGHALLSDEGATSALLCRRERLSDAVGVLRAGGVRGSISVQSAEYVFGEANPVMQILRSALKR